MINIFMFFISKIKNNIFSILGLILNKFKKTAPKKTKIIINKKYKILDGRIDQDFEYCIKILAKKLNEEEFNSVSNMIINLLYGYSYGYDNLALDIINQEIGFIRNKEKRTVRRRKHKVVRLQEIKWGG